ncbi:MULTISPECIES: hypothetical protein [Mycolicibacter]|uniref:Uncharacterized protein n=1 Tax=Mycolicibacter virginiensis TaxID=1795032 RepID=A0A9X7IKY4_9MYCO|nr:MULTISPECIES: hypothetical protein [Mycolicibacter]OBJ30055.1 hypothetical protein A5631_16815 [Mycolicibacter heraklionensis]PQM51171.1 hypothetical protein C5U48_16415 [Mycolicibacter virginiensis]ULP47089.1 hypothetical protein MJO54_20345 [Mycolicibacter virginiensis]
MQLTLNPFITGSLAITSAALVAVAPAAPQLEILQHRPVELTAVASSAAATNLGFIVIDDGTVGLFPLGPMADMLGLGNVTLAQIVNFLGMGDDQLSDLLPGLINGLGLGHTTVGTLVSGLGLSDIGLAGLLNGLVDGLGLDSVTLGGLVDGLGLGGLNVGALALGLVDGLGLGGVTLDQLVTGLGFGDMELKDLAPILTALGSAVPGLNNVTFGDVVSGLGMSNVQLSTILTDLGGNAIFLNTLLGWVGVIPGLNNITTLGGLLELAGLTNAAVFPGVVNLLTDPAAGVGGISLSSALDVLGLDGVTLNQLLPTLPLNMSVASLLGGLGLDDSTLGDLLGSGLIPSGATVGGLVDSLGLSSTTLDSLIAGLNGSGLSLLNDSLNDLLTNVGVDDATIADLLTGLGLYDHALFSFSF